MKSPYVPFRACEPSVNSSRSYGVPCTLWVSEASQSFKSSQPQLAWSLSSVFLPEHFDGTVRDDVIRKVGIKRAIIHIAKARSSWLCWSKSLYSFIRHAFVEWLGCFDIFLLEKSAFSPHNLLPHLQHAAQYTHTYTSRHSVSWSQWQQKELQSRNLNLFFLICNSQFTWLNRQDVCKAAYMHGEIDRIFIVKKVLFLNYFPYFRALTPSFFSLLLFTSGLRPVVV